MSSIFSRNLAVAALPVVLWFSALAVPALSTPILFENMDGSGVNLFPIARPTSCTPTDLDCLNIKAVEITNEIRARNGVNSKLVPGPKAMLDNAKKWSKYQQGAGMQHQSPLPSLACGINVNRENVAMFGGMNRDPAEQCMEQWEGSPGHKVRLNSLQMCAIVSLQK